MSTRLKFLYGNDKPIEEMHVIYLGLSLVIEGKSGKHVFRIETKERLDNIQMQ